VGTISTCWCKIFGLDSPPSGALDALAIVTETQIADRPGRSGIDSSFCMTSGVLLLRANGAKFESQGLTCDYCGTCFDVFGL
jgi:hypothetical protein